MNCLRCGKDFNSEDELLAHYSLRDCEATKNDISYEECIRLRNVKPVPFMDSDYSYIKDVIYDFVGDSNMIFDFGRIMQFCHFNPLHPENHNIYVKNRRKKIIYLLDKNREFTEFGRDEDIDIILNIIMEKINDIPGIWDKDIPEEVAAKVEKSVRRVIRKNEEL